MGEPTFKLKIRFRDETALEVPGIPGPLKVLREFCTGLVNKGGVIHLAKGGEIVVNSQHILFIEYTPET